MHVNYFQGLSLGESYLRSLGYAPFQQMFLGDPLTRPFAHLLEQVGIQAGGQMVRRFGITNPMAPSLPSALGASEACLKLIPGLEARTIESSCCGMAGAFGYQARHQAISMQMAELSLLPAVRAAGPDTVLVADGTSCRHQIHGGSGRQALHLAQVLQAALA